MRPDLRRTIFTRALVVLFAAFFAAWTYASTVVDMRALITRQEERRGREYDEQHKDDSDRLYAAGRPFHRGAPPCYRYTSARELQASPEEVAQIQGELRAAGFLPTEVASAQLVWARWGYADEQARHGEDTDAELLAIWNALADPYERAVAALAPRKLTLAMRSRLDQLRGAQAGQLAQADRWFDGLSSERQASLRAIWDRHRRAVDLGNNHGAIDTLPADGTSKVDGPALDAGADVAVHALSDGSSDAGRRD
jgi:hypothetical protein